MNRKIWRSFFALALAGCRTVPLAAQSQEGRPVELPPVIASVPPATPACRSRPLTFHPDASTNYRFSAEERASSDREGTQRKLYESTVRFEASSVGWTAHETSFRTPFTPWNYGDLKGAWLDWVIAADGRPVADPVGGGGQASLATVQALSMFSFRAVLVLPSTCPGATGEIAYTDRGRHREVRLRVLEADAERARLAVVIQRGDGESAWHLEGEAIVALDDGLTGETRLHELGPGAPAFEVNDNRRVIRIRRE